MAAGDLPSTIARMSVDPSGTVRVVTAGLAAPEGPAAVEGAAPVGLTLLWQLIAAPSNATTTGIARMAGVYHPENRARSPTGRGEMPGRLKFLSSCRAATSTSTDVQG